MGVCKRGHSDWYDNGRCRPCAIERANGWVKKNPEKRKQIAADWYVANKDVTVERAVNWHATPRGRATCLVKLASYRAQKKGIPFAITVDGISKRIAHGFCEVTGLPFSLKNGTGNRSPYSPSLDQIEAGKGYTEENTRVVCAAVNFACGTWGLEAFIPIAEAMLRAQNKRKAA